MSKKKQAPPAGFVELDLSDGIKQSYAAITDRTLARKMSPEEVAAVERRLTALEQPPAADWATKKTEQIISLLVDASERQLNKGVDLALTDLLRSILAAALREAEQRGREQGWAEAAAFVDQGVDCVAATIRRQRGEKQ